MKNENLSDGEMNIVDSAVQQIEKSESLLKESQAEVLSFT